MPLFSEGVGKVGHDFSPSSLTVPFLWIETGAEILFGQPMHDFRFAGISLDLPVDQIRQVPLNFTSKKIEPRHLHFITSVYLMAKHK